MDRPYGNLFLSIGAMKASTTWLSRLLARHPDLAFAREKELHYLYHEYAEGTLQARLGYLRYMNKRILRRKNPGGGHGPAGLPERISRNAAWVTALGSQARRDQWYVDLFGRQDEARWICDFSNLSAVIPSAGWAQILEKSDNLRILYTLRHPLDRLWSELRFLATLKGTTEDLQDAEAHRLLQLAQRHWNHSAYDDNLRQILDVVPRSNVHVQFTDDLHQDTRSSLRGIEEFLELPPARYPKWLIEKTINAAEPMAIPEFLVAEFGPATRKVIAGLDALGYPPPDHWQDRF